MTNEMLARIPVMLVFVACAFGLFELGVETGYDKFASEALERREREERERIKVYCEHRLPPPRVGELPIGYGQRIRQPFCPQDLIKPVDSE